MTTLMRSLVSAVIAVSVAGSIACGQKPDETAKAVTDAQKGAEQMAKGFEALAKGVQQAAGAAMADTKPVDPVSFRDLEAIFPDFSGWDKGKPTGERMTRPFPYSQGQVTYTRGDSRIDAKITDSGFNQLLLAPFAMFLSAGYSRESDNGYERFTKLGDYPGWEKWNSQDKDGELNAVVNKRFLVSFEGRRLSDPKVLRDLAGKTDIGKLGKLATTK